MIDRRKFLERSVMSTGSVLFSSALLQSCTKYGIPLPGGGHHPGGNTPPPLTPPLLELEINWNDAAKTAVTTGLEAIPEVGEILGPLVDIFWPSTKEDVWGEVKDRVEALVDQKIAAAVYQQVIDDLNGLYNVIIIYQNYVKAYNATLLTDPKADATDVRTAWMTTKFLFAERASHFYSAGNELPLLGLFVQFANLQLSVLRDGVIAGESWGMSEAEQQQDVADLQRLIPDYVDYVQRIYEVGNTNLIAKTPIDNITHIEPFKTLNAYNRQMTLMAFDFAQAWPYYDVTKYPNGGTVVYTREIYSDPYGTCNDSGSFRLPQIQTKQFPTNISVWANTTIDAVQLTYPTGSGPDGVTTTPRMGASDGPGSGSNQPPYGGVFNLTPDNPITKVRVLYMDWDSYGHSYNLPTGMQFQFSDGTTTSMLGNHFGGGSPSDTGLFGYLNEALSSITINGIIKNTNSADCVVFGFLHRQSPAATLNAIRNLYVKSPKEHSMADFANAFPNLAIPAGLITFELKVARLAYWAYIELRAKEIK